MLQGAGRADVVARYGAITALSLPFVSLTATLLIGLSGAAATFLVAIALANIVMLVRAGVRGYMLLAHAILVGVVLMAGAGSLVEPGIGTSTIVSFLTVVTVVLLGILWRGRLWGHVLSPS
jgi:hypothetical protein